MRQFAGSELGGDRIPEEAVILNFRHLLERRGVTEAMFADGNAHRADKGITLRFGTLVNATKIDAPNSTTNKSRARDPGTLSTKKDNDWYFRMKAHIRVDVDSGTIDSLGTLRIACGLTSIMHPGVGLHRGRTWHARHRLRAIKPRPRHALQDEFHPPEMAQLREAKLSFGVRPSHDTLGAKSEALKTGIVDVAEHHDFHVMLNRKRGKTEGGICRIIKRTSHAGCDDDLFRSGKAAGRERFGVYARRNVLADRWTAAIVRCQETVEVVRFVWREPQQQGGGQLLHQATLLKVASTTGTSRAPARSDTSLAAASFPRFGRSQSAS